MSKSQHSKWTQKWQEFLPKSFACLFQQRYDFQIFRKDLLSGITVGIVALPLAMAFAIASGVLPERGIYTAIVAGFLISLLSGSKVQIGGPTGAFVVIVYDIVQREGYAGLIVATLMAGVLLIAMGFCRLGTLIKYIPYPLVTGFTAGIAVIIFSSQVKDFFGLQIAVIPADFVGKWKAIFAAFPTWDPYTLGIAGGTLAVIVLIRRFTPFIPWGIASIALATLVCWGFHFPVETIASRFGQVPRTLPLPGLPEISLSFQAICHLIPDAITIALLAGIESLLSAVVADGMSGGRHRSNVELIAQGLANVGACFFGGIPATGAIARTATNIRTGAKTPVSGMVHALVLFLVLLFLAPVVSLIPLAGLSAVLMMVAWNMSEWESFRHLFKAPRGDIAVLLTAFSLTILVDLTVAVQVGMVLASFLFIKRMSDFSRVLPLTQLIQEEETEGRDPDAISKKHVPAGVEVFEIDGPLFFGVADRLQNVLHNIEMPPRIFVLRMRKVSVIDASGLHALHEFCNRCHKMGVVVILSGAKGELLHALQSFGIEEKVGKENILPHIDLALRRSLEILIT